MEIRGHFVDSFSLNKNEYKIAENIYNKIFNYNDTENNKRLIAAQRKILIEIPTALRIIHCGRNFIGTMEGLRKTFFPKTSLNVLSKHPQ